ncbi:9176_t:CDS:2 [Dentiscutata heterogama]|uniref:9176_t:CDS:1 n=1 Tax=Dentiscutata heterogama TaxID=1316150 RepID=A0ACA9K2J5_9GLOM|nr:9176_t:CDS:2 [Dentiscutata heterogama]
MTWKLWELSKLDKMLIYKQETYFNIPAPYVYIISYYNFTVDCVYGYGGYIYSESNQDCTQKITRIYNNSTSSFPFISIFRSNLTLTSHIDEDAPSADLHINQTGSLNMTYISFNINQTNQTNPSTTLFQLFDPESQGLLDDSEYANTFVLGSGNLYTLKYIKQIREVLVSVPSSIFSLSPKYERIPYITSNLATVYMSYLGNQSILSVGCASTTIETEEERLILTLLDVFGFVGGLFTLATSINIFLFGENTKNPWGIVQTLSCCGIKKRVQNILYEHLKDQIPFADEGAHLDYPPEKIEDRISAIEQRHKALEFLLRDYVVNVNILRDNDIDNRFYKFKNQT